LTPLAVVEAPSGQGCPIRIGDTRHGKDLIQVKPAAHAGQG